MDKLTAKEVLHVANLARLNVKEDEIERYSNQLSSILTEIDKIATLNIEEEGDILISPTSNKNVYKEDIEGPMLTKKEIFKNTNNTSDDYVVVPKVIND
jgi:aspartyl-tRNA(Asn)/glutamyl-tRNA(Gln) amidotransferase subunit C